MSQKHETVILIFLESKEKTAIKFDYDNIPLLLIKNPSLKYLDRFFAQQR